MAHENAPLSNTNSQPNFQVPIDIVVNQRDFRGWIAEMESKEGIANAKRIPKVPTYLRDKEYYKKCFDPVIVSLGPYHHGKPHLKFMEEYKFNVLKRFIGDDFSRKAVSYYDQLEQVILEAKQWYKEPITMQDEDFKIMMFVDACFIVQEIGETIHRSKKRESDYDPLLVMKDMMMLENQIPFPVVKKLMSIKYSSETNWEKNFGKVVSILMGIVYGSKVEECGNPSESIHLLDLCRKTLLGHGQKEEISRSPCGWSSCLTVTELKGAGIRCEDSTSPYLDEIDFKESRTLSLPSIVVNELTKHVFVNMIAYEIIPGGPPDHGIRSYVSFMAALIDREEDVKELRDREILLGELDTDKKLVDFFNGLKTDLVSDEDAHADVKRAMVQHCMQPSVRCRALCKMRCVSYMLELYRNNFKSPWTIIGLCAAIVLLFLQVAQTYFTVYPRPQSKGMGYPFLSFSEADFK